MGETGVLKKLFEYKAWANGEMLAAMTQMDGAAPATEIAIRTLTHTFVVDEIFAAHMKGAEHGYDSANTLHAPSLADLSEAIAAGDRELIDYVAELDEAQLGETIDFSFTDGAPGRMSRAEMLMHLIVHGGLHRGQIGWILTLEGATPPADGLAGYLHKAEAATRRRLAVAAVPVEAPRRAVEAPAEGASPLQALTDRLASGLGPATRFGKTVKFDLKGEGVIFIDGEATTNEDRPADLTLTISMEDLRAIGQGKLSTMGAVTSGRLQLSNMGLAVGLQDQLKTLFAATA